MFQNIIDVEKEETSNAEEVSKKRDIKNTLKKLFTKQNILVYILSFMLSMVSGINGIAPFGLAIFAATLSNALPTGIIYILSMVGTLVGFGRTRLAYIFFNFTCFYCNGTDYKTMV